MTAAPTRRAMLAGMAAIPALAVTACPTSAPAAGYGEWRAVVAKHRETYPAWVAAQSKADNLRAAALHSLPPRPDKPGSNLPDNIKGMTVAEILAACDAPEQKAAWAAYERDDAAWKRARDEAMTRHGVADARLRADVAWQSFAAATDALSTHPVHTLGELAEKVEIVATEYRDDSLPDRCIDAILADIRRLAGAA